MAFETIMSISLTVSITNVSLIVNSHFLSLCGLSEQLAAVISHVS